jgi:hypothetical protein
VFGAHLALFKARWASVCFETCASMFQALMSSAFTTH